MSTGNLCIIIMVGLVVCIGRGANDGDEDKTLAEAHNAPNDDGHPDTYANDRYQNRQMWLLILTSDQ